MSAINTSKTFLMHGTTNNGTTTWSKLIDIKTFPDLGGDKEQIDVTTLSDIVRKFINGIESFDSLNFTANYSKADLTALEALEDKDEQYAVWIGGTVSGGVVTPDGTNGKFEFTGQLSAYLVGKGVNEAHEINITINTSSAIVLS